jgi:hypothetical protein
MLLLLLQSEVLDSSYNNATKHRNAKGEKERKKEETRKMTILIVF